MWTSASPAGRRHTTVSPTFAPIIARASGEAQLILPAGDVGFVVADDRELLLVAFVVLDFHDGAEMHLVARLVGGVDERRALELRAEIAQIAVDLAHFLARLGIVVRLRASARSCRSVSSRTRACRSSSPFGVT